MKVSLRCCRQWLCKPKALWIVLIFYVGALMLKNNDSVYRLQEKKVDQTETALNLRWATEATKAEYVNETRLRCAAENMGCFTLIPNASPAFVKNSMTQEECLDMCFKRDNPFAGLLRGKCYCSETVDNFVVARLCDVACSIDKSMNCRNPDSITVFRKTVGCIKGFTQASLRGEFVGCTPLPANLTGRMVALTMPQMTIQQCILKCESVELILAIPAVKHGICICSDLTSMFNTAEEMHDVMKSCSVTDLKILEEKNVFPIYKGYIEECAPKRFLKRKQGPFTILTSFWGSGNTWLRHLIEVATGIYSGSAYMDDYLYRGGMLGEKLHVLTCRTIIIKDHIMTKPELVNKKYTAAVLILRNPYDATLAEYARLKTHNNHTALLDPTIYESAGFRSSVRELPGKWIYHVEMLFKLIPKVLVVFYEDLKDNPVRELKRIISFLPSDLVQQDPELEKRLMCMNLDMTGNFKRGSKGLRQNPFDKSLQKLYSYTIKNMDSLLKSKNKAGLPSSYFNEWNL